MVIAEFAAGLLEHFHVGIIELPAGADAIEEDAHLHPGAGAFAERVAEGVPDFVRVNDVGLEVDRLARRRGSP